MDHKLEETVTSAAEAINALRAAHGAMGARAVDCANGLEALILLVHAASQSMPRAAAVLIGDTVIDALRHAIPESPGAREAFIQINNEALAILARARAAVEAAPTIEKQVQDLLQGIMGGHRNG